MEPTTDTNQPVLEAMCFRISRRFFVVGCVCTVCFISIGVASTTAAYCNLDGSFPRPKLSALIFGVFWAAWTVLSVVLIVAYFREELILSRFMIAYRGILRKKLIEPESVTRIKWRTWPARGSLVVRNELHRVTVSLGNFNRDQQEQILQYFRNGFSIELQDNWLPFENMRRELSLPASPRAKQFVRYTLFAAALILLLFGIVFGYCWYTGLGTKYLSIAIVNISAALISVSGAFIELWYLGKPSAKASVDSPTDSEGSASQGTV